MVNPRDLAGNAEVEIYLLTTSSRPASFVICSSSCLHWVFSRSSSYCRLMSRSSLCRNLQTFTSEAVTAFHQSVVSANKMYSKINVIAHVGCSPWSSEAITVKKQPLPPPPQKKPQPKNKTKSWIATFNIISITLIIILQLHNTMTVLQGYKICCTFLRDCADWPWELAHHSGDLQDGNWNTILENIKVSIIFSFFQRELWVSSHWWHFCACAH